MKWDSRRRSGLIKAASWGRTILTSLASQRGVTLDFSGPGKPTDHVFIDSFNAGPSALALAAPEFGLPAGRHRADVELGAMSAAPCDE